MSTTPVGTSAPQDPERQDPELQGAEPQDSHAPSSCSGGSLPEGVALRPATIEDVEEIAFAELELFPDEAWTVFQLAEEIEHPDRRYAVAEDAAGRLLGYAGIMLAGETADLHTIGSREPGRGIGRALLAWCEQQASHGGAERILLEVREDNARARALYTAAGWTELGVRRGYYRIRGRRIDAIVMEKALTAAP